MICCRFSCSALTTPRVFPAIARCTLEQYGSDEGDAWKEEAVGVTLQHCWSSLRWALRLIGEDVHPSLHRPAHAKQGVTSVVALGMVSLTDTKVCKARGTLTICSAEIERSGPEYAEEFPCKRANRSVGPRDEGVRVAKTNGKACGILTY